VTGGVPRRGNDTKASDHFAIHKGMRGQRCVSPDGCAGREREDFVQTTDMIGMVMTEQYVADIGPARPDIRQGCTNRTGRAGEPGVDKRDPVGMRHKKTSDIEVHRVGASHPSRKMNVEGHRTHRHATRLGPATAHRYGSEYARRCGRSALRPCRSCRSCRGAALPALPRLRLYRLCRWSGAGQIASDSAALRPYRPCRCATVLAMCGEFFEVNTALSGLVVVYSVGRMLGTGVC
jgi:hypothetical protein